MSVSHTPAAVPTPATRPQKDLAGLDDGDLRHLAERIASVWIRTNTMQLLAVLLPFGSCFALIDAVGDVVVPFAMLGLIVLGTASLIARQIYKRSLALEVESLGYTPAVAKAAQTAWMAARNSFLPPMTRAGRVERATRELTALRDEARS